MSAHLSDSHHTKLNKIESGIASLVTKDEIVGANAESNSGPA